MLIINADDWGKNHLTNINILKCWKHGRISSVSGMVFMEGSEESAELSNEFHIDTGLHLNFVEKYDIKNSICRRQNKIKKYLKKNKFNFLIYNPLLKSDFLYVSNEQLNEFERIYKKKPSHIDGHHHMHLSTNIVLSNIISNEYKVRKNFTFFKREKMFLNIKYRRLVDLIIKSKHICTDYFFDIEPIGDEERLKKIINISKYKNVEVMVHPGKTEQYKYLISEKFNENIRNVKIGSYKDLK